MPYDISILEHDVAAFMQDPKSIDNRERVKDSLNLLFKDSKCYNIVFTKNTDKMFFGTVVYPNLGDDQVEEIVGKVSNEDILHVQSYSLDIDSKMLEVLSLTPGELTALLLHDVGHMVNGVSAAKIVQREIMDFFISENEILNPDQIIYCIDFIRFCVADAMMKSTSIWFRDEDVSTDDMVSSFGYADQLESAMSKVVSNAYSSATKQPNIPKYIMLDWAFRMYERIYSKRVEVLAILKRSKDITGSMLLRSKLDFLIKTFINYVAPAAAVKGDIANPLVSKEFVTESAFSNLKARGITSLENEYFEYKLRLPNLEDEDEALQYMREVNSKMIIIANYMAANKISKSDEDRCRKLYAMYSDLRDQLSNAKVYKRKNYGLWYDYNMISPDKMKSYEA